MPSIRVHPCHPIRSLFFGEWTALSARAAVKDGHTRWKRRRPRLRVRAPSRCARPSATPPAPSRRCDRPERCQSCTGTPCRSSRLPFPNFDLPSPNFSPLNTLVDKPSLHCYPSTRRPAPALGYANRAFPRRSLKLHQSRSSPLVSTFGHFRPIGAIRCKPFRILHFEF